MEKLKNFIDGQFVHAHSDKEHRLVSPVNDEEIGVAPVSDATDVDHAMKAAKKAFQSWKKTTPQERFTVLLKFADALEEAGEKIASEQNRNTGQPKPIIMQEEVKVGCDQLRFFAAAQRNMSGVASGEYMHGYTSTIRREPLGVISQVTPWNYPFLMLVWKIGPALATGNTVVVKPPSNSPGSTLVVAEVAQKILPPGVFNVLLGNYETGNAMNTHKIPAMCAITGSVHAGIEVASHAAKDVKKAHLELGGKAPVVVFDDVDVAATAEGIAGAGFFNCGQDCTAACRVIAHESIAEQLTAELVKQARALKVGADDDCDMGPLNNASHFKGVKAFIDELPDHITIECGGKPIEGPGCFFEPTVLSGCHQDDRVIQEEIFGPVITVQTFSTKEEALEMANGVEFALASSVWTKDLATAELFERELDFGCVWVNVHVPLVAEMPHGGFKHSGYGKDLSIYGLEDYTRIKHVMVAHES